MHADRRRRRKLPPQRRFFEVSGFHSALDADVPLGQRVDNDTYAASLYMSHKFASGAVVDGQFSMGTMGFDTLRQVQFLNT